MLIREIFTGCIIGMTLVTNASAEITSKSGNFNAPSAGIYLAQTPLAGAQPDAIGSANKPVGKPHSADSVGPNGEKVTVNVDDLIRARTAEGWTHPPSARKGLSVMVKIEFLQDGTIKSVNIVKSSGDAPFDRSVVAAVKHIGRVAEIQSLTPSSFTPDRALKITFALEDSAL